MRVAYFPGCTLKTSAKNFEDSALASAEALGMKMVELPRWNCCGTVYSLTSDDLIHNLGPIRNLIRAEEQKANILVTLCSMCYNTLKRANIRVKNNSEELEKINQFMYREDMVYDGKVTVHHFLTLLKDHIGFSHLKAKVKQPLKNVKLAPYYGCTLLRPREVGIDHPENPTILTEFIEALGGDPVDFPYETECCGSYQVVGAPDLIISRTMEIINSARALGADMVLTSCPLCDYNLGRYQLKVKEKHPDFELVPTIYFTQALALALGLGPVTYRFDLNYIDPMSVVNRLERESGTLSNG